MVLLLNCGQYAIELLQVDVINKERKVKLHDKHL